MATPPVAPGLPGTLQDRPDFHTGGHNPLVQFAAALVGPPSQLYLGPDDNLRVSFNSNDIVTPYTIQIRILKPDGKIVIQQEALQSTTAFVIQSFNYRLTEGFLLSIAITGNSVTTRGYAYALLNILRGFGTGLLNPYAIASGYVSVMSPLYWPDSRPDYPQQLPGLLVPETQANPAAGVDWTFQAPSNRRLRPIAISALLTTSATVANRIPSLQFRLATTVFQASTSVPIVAGSAVTIEWGPGLPETAIINNQILVPLPVGFQVASTPISLQIGPVTAGIQVGDQWSAISLLCEETVEQ